MTCLSCLFRSDFFFTVIIVINGKRNNDGPLYWGPYSGSTTIHYTIRTYVNLNILSNGFFSIYYLL